MTCDETRERFSDFIDEALGPAERSAVEAHLAGCGECPRELDRFRRSVALLARIEPARAPVGFVDRVMAAVRREPWHRRALKRLLLPLPVKLPLHAAATVVVALLAVYLWERSPELRQATESPPVRESAPASPPVSPSPAPRAPAASAPAPEGSAPAPTPPALQESSESASGMRPTGGLLSARRAAPPAPTTPEPKLRESSATPAPPPTAASGPPAAVTEPRPTDPTSGPAPMPPPAATAPSQSAVPRQAPSPAPAPAAPPPAPMARDQARQALEQVQPGRADSPPAAPQPLPRPSPQAAPAPGRSDAAGSRPSPPTPPTLERDPARKEGSRVLGAHPPPQVGRVLRGSDVSGGLLTTDTAAALAALDRLAAEVGAAQLARRVEGNATIVDLVVPRAAWERLDAGLRRIGRWTPDTAPAPALPSDVHVSVRVLR